MRKFLFTLQLGAGLAASFWEYSLDYVRRFWGYSGPVTAPDLHDYEEDGDD